MLQQRLHFFVLLFAISVNGFCQAKMTYLAEGFDDNKNNWIQEKTNDYSFAIEEGHMVIHAYTTAVHAVQNVNLQKEDAFGLHSRMIFFNGTSEGWMGLRFGMSDDAKKYITFCYNNAQGFLVSVNNGKKYEVLRQSKSTVVKPYDYNTLTVLKTQDNYKFLINDKQVFSDDIKSFFGPKISLYISDNMSARVDEVQVFDPKKGKQRIIPTQATMAKTTDQDLNEIILSESSLPEDFKQFVDSFEKFALPYDYSTVIPQARRVTQLPFVQKNFFEYEISTIRNHQEYSVALLSVCQNGYTFLMASEYDVNSQHILKLYVVAFDRKGVKLGTKAVGSTVEQNGKYYQTLHFRASRSGSAILFNVEETYFNGNINKQLVSFNGDLCNLNSY